MARRRITEGMGALARTCERSDGDRSGRGMPPRLSTPAVETNELSKSLANGMIWAWLQPVRFVCFQSFLGSRLDRNSTVQISDRREKSLCLTLEDLVLCL